MKWSKAPDLFLEIIPDQLIFVGRGRFTNHRPPLFPAPKPLAGVNFTIYDPQKFPEDISPPYFRTRQE